jgi:hypothetical protein
MCVRPQSVCNLSAMPEKKSFLHIDVRKNPDKMVAEQQRF